MPEKKELTLQSLVEKMLPPLLVSAVLALFALAVTVNTHNAELVQLHKDVDETKVMVKVLLDRYHGESERKVVEGIARIQPFLPHDDGTAAAAPR